MTNLDASLPLSRGGRAWVDRERGPGGEGLPLVITDPNEALSNPLILGGKAANLARLEALGLAIPPWYAITTRAFHEAVKGIKGAAIANVSIPPELEREVERAHALRIPDNAYVAVRSSAAGEDAAGESFAGLHDSFLYIKGWDNLFDAIRRVWASAYNERALAYRRAKGISLDNIAVAVVVQRMVDAHAAGVLFTANPNDGNVYEAVVSSLWGAGEGLVSVGLDADTFTVDKETLEIREQIAVKSERMILNEAAGGGLLRTEVSPEMRETPSLTPDQVKELVTAGLDLERRFRRPQDIEFAVDRSGKLFLLQARPVTTVEELGPAAGHRLLWDNSNIIESYSGVTSPMTFSFIRRAYSIVYHCFAEVMGIDAPTVRANRDVFDNMLGLFRGQVYYNLFNWYRLVRLFPGFNYNKTFMESMMGVREGLQEEPAAVTGVQRYTRELPALLRLVGRSTLNFLRIRTIVSDFQAHFREHYERWSALDFRTMAPHELGALYREMEEKLLWQWKAPIINDFFVMVFYGTLKKLCANWCGDEAGSLQNDLIVGEGGIESTEPTRMLLRLAAQAREMPDLRQLLLERSPEDLVAEVPARFPEFGAEIRRYLDLYGFRGVNELKLEEPSVKDRPAFVYQILRNYITGDPSALDLSVIGEREQRIRREAETRAFEAIRKKGGLLPRAAIFRKVLNNARLGVKNRENMRFARTRIYGVLREILRAVGEHFTEEGILDAPQDIFYLTLDEVWDYTRGRAVTINLKALVALRREEFDAYRREADRMPADRFETFGLPYHRNRFQGRPRPVIVSEDGLLRGIGCSPGVVTKPVKVIRTPSEDARLEGEILVAERTDPGWVPLYPSVSGLLIERGSILSHSAIVAREMGIPTIVGIPGLTATLQSGQVVTMNGAAGTVTPHG
jgi:rifampicin phosphotransferase